MLIENDVNFLSQRLTFWNQLSMSEKNLILNNAIPVSYKQGQTIHSSASNCLGLLLIKSGILRTYMLSEEGKEITLYRLYDGEVCILSASCLLKNITFDVYMDAEEDSEVILINVAAFEQLSRQNLHAELFSYKLAADRFSDVMWAMQQILFMSFDKRLAIFLIDEISKTGGDAITLTHEQIAKYMGSAREVVSRMLKYFESEGMVELSRGNIKILDKGKLRSLT